MRWRARPAAAAHGPRRLLGTLRRSSGSPLPRSRKSAAGSIASARRQTYEISQFTTPRFARNLASRRLDRSSRRPADAVARSALAPPQVDLGEFVSSGVVSIKPRRPATLAPSTLGRQVAWTVVKSTDWPNEACPYRGITRFPALSRNSPSTASPLGRVNLAKCLVPSMDLGHDAV